MCKLQTFLKQGWGSISLPTTPPPPLFHKCCTLTQALKWLLWEQESGCWEESKPTATSVHMCSFCVFKRLLYCIVLEQKYTPHFYNALYFTNDSGFLVKIKIKRNPCFRYSGFKWTHPDRVLVLPWTTFMTGRTDNSGLSSSSFSSLSLLCMHMSTYMLVKNSFKNTWVPYAPVF